MPEPVHDAIAAASALVTGGGIEQKRCTMKRFSEDHQWVEVDGDTVTIGITSYAVEELGEITFVEFPEPGTVVAPGDTLCVVESAKAAADVYVPVGGTVREVNTPLETDPTLLNVSPEKEGWLCILEDVDLEELDSLMDEDAYEAFLERGDAGE